VDTWEIESIKDLDPEKAWQTKTFL
jgi:hypothetical protein